MPEHVESCSYTNKNIYLYYHNAYGHQTWQSGNLPWRDPTNNVTLITLWLRDLPRSRDKLKPYLYYNSVYGQSWQDGDLPWGVPRYKVTWPLDNMVFRDYKKN